MSTVKSDGNAYQVGEWFSLTNRAQVTSTSPVPHRPNHVTCRTQDGQEWIVSKQLLSQGAWSARQYTQEQTVTHQRLIQLIEQVNDTVFTVHFTKQPNITDMASLLDDELDNLDTVTKRRRLCRRLLNGKERTLVGQLIRVEPKLGRFVVKDLEIAQDNENTRLVDIRTIKWVITRGIKYTRSQ